MFVLSRCAAGHYGDPTRLGDYCRPCDCNSNIDVNDPNSCDRVTGQCLVCLNNTAGSDCGLCQDWWFGDAIRNKDCSRTCNCYIAYLVTTVLENYNWWFGDAIRNKDCSRTCNCYIAYLVTTVLENYNWWFGDAIRNKDCSRTCNCYIAYLVTTVLENYNWWFGDAIRNKDCSRTCNCI